MRGAYLVLYLDGRKPEFVAKGTGSWYWGDLNVDIAELNENWVEDTVVIYIGQAGARPDGSWSDGNLKDRIRCYMRYGQGKSCPHKGGRSIWQIKDAEKLYVCWKELPNKTVNPKAYEGAIIQEFKDQYRGKRPFANRQD